MITDAICPVIKDTFRQYFIVLFGMLSFKCIYKIVFNPKLIRTKNAHTTAQKMVDNILGSTGTNKII